MLLLCFLQQVGFYEVEMLAKIDVELICKATILNTTGE